MSETDPTGDAPASAVPDPRDRRRGDRTDRRSGADRRAGAEAPAGVERRQTDRRQTERRQDPSAPEIYRGNVRSINEYPLDADELEFINALNAYKQRHSRQFPTWSEVLHVLRHLGYRKVPAAPQDSGSKGP